MNRNRVLQQSLGGRGLSGILLLLPENILFASGYWPSTAAAYLVPGHGPATLIVPKPDEALVPGSWDGEVLSYDTRLDDDPSDLYIAKLIEKAATNSGMADGTVGCDRTMETIAGTHIGGEAYVPGGPFYSLLCDLLPKAKLEDSTPWIYQLRMVKSPDEVEAIRRCTQVVDNALDEARARLAAGMKETELAAVIEGSIQSNGVGLRGANRARGYAFVMSGPEHTATAWAAYNISTDRRMREGDLVLVELDSQVDGYWSDISRTFVVGDADERQHEVWEAVHDCQRYTVDALRAGMKISSVDSTARQFLAARGLADSFLHHVGHGVGFAFHEPPYLDPPGRVVVDSELAPGMVLAIEPGVYIEGWGGVRIEDNVVITEGGGAEFLSVSNRDL